MQMVLIKVWLLYCLLSISVPSVLEFKIVLRQMLHDDRTRDFFYLFKPDPDDVIGCLSFKICMS